MTFKRGNDDKNACALLEIHPSHQKMSSGHRIQMVLLYNNIGDVYR